MWKPVHIYIPYFLFWTDEQFILELSSELLLPYGVALYFGQVQAGSYL